MSDSEKKIFITSALCAVAVFFCLVIYTVTRAPEAVPVSASAAMQDQARITEEEAAFALSQSDSVEEGQAQEDGAQPAPSLSDAVVELKQLPEMPAGCEIVSLTSILRGMGHDVTAAEIYEKNLKHNDDVSALYEQMMASFESHEQKGARSEGDASQSGSEAQAETDSASIDFVNYYLGDPYKEGWGFPAVIADAGNSYLSTKFSGYRFESTVGESLDSLIDIANSGTPVLIWTTMYMGDPRFTDITVDGYRLYSNEHCVVLVRAQDDKVTVMDPLEGFIERDRARFADIYMSCGRLAVTLQKDF